MAQNPDYKKEVDNSKNINIDITSIPEFDIEDYNLDNTKEFSRYIKRLEIICRTSFEYKQLINYLRDNSGFNKCTFMQNVSNEIDKGIKIHIHHHPLTLYDIVWTIANKNRITHKSMHENIIAREVMYNHYILHVGLIPLSETVHEAVHSQSLFVPLWAVFGKWREFVDEYKDYMDPNTLSNLEKLDKLSDNYNHEDNVELLSHKYVDVNISDDEYSPTKEERYDKVVDILNYTKNKKI